MAYKVLYVEDEAVDVLLFKRGVELLKLDWELVILRNGMAAAEHIKDDNNSPAECAVLDLNLPGYSGLELLAMMRENPAWAKTPVLILTTSDSERDINAATTGGANAYLVKPDTPGELNQALQSIHNHMDTGAPLPGKQLS